MKQNHLHKITGSLLYLLAAFSLIGCAHSPVQTKATVNQDIPAPECTVYPVETASVIPMSAAKPGLLISLENISGYEMDQYLLIDMDHDGLEELIGVYADDLLWQVWYINNSGDVCEHFPISAQGFDQCNLELVEFKNETHVAVNVFNMMGNNKRYSILALKDQKLQALVSDQYGYVSQNEEEDILLNVEAYDGYYDSASGIYMSHTWKDSYLYYDNGTYKEYGALKLSEKQFMQYENSSDILSDIRHEKNSDEIQFSYFLRENGIVHVGCSLTTEDESIQFFYYTLQTDGRHLTGGLEDVYEGQMESYFSTLEVTYPNLSDFFHA